MRLWGSPLLLAAIAVGLWALVFVELVRDPSWDLVWLAVGAAFASGLASAAISQAFDVEEERRSVADAIGIYGHDVQDTTVRVVQREETQ